TLRRKGEGWEVAGPFTVAAPRDVVDRLVAALVAPRALRYRAHAAADLKPYGLDPPGVKVTLVGEGGKEHTLLLGGGAVQGRFGRLQGSKAVFIISDTLANAADRSALDFLDRGLLKFDADAATGLRRQAGKEALELEKKEDGWKLVKPRAQDADDR